ncbi:MAG: hypothetical protein HS100_16105 [Anaerolineales bacterium]|nr:hypothetical protein [Anaerolineales bacterium]
MRKQTPENVPSVKEYLAAFQKIESKMTEKQKQMLIEHYNSDCHVTTATDLAISVEFNSHGAANMQYGILGSMVSEALGLGKLGVITLVLMIPPNNYSTKEWLWVMRENVAKALEQLGWVKKTSHLFYPNGKVGPDLDEKTEE